MAILADSDRPDSGLARLRGVGERAGTELGARVNVSFEFFPPTDPDMEVLLWATVCRLEQLAPRFVSVTCGADGSTRDRTLEVVRRLRAETGFAVAPHVTSIGSSRSAILELVREYWNSGIRHLVALRGDLPSCSTGLVASSDAVLSGLDLVRTVRSVADFDVSVAAYPEVHPQARSPRDDLDNLKRKIDAGATRAITQFFYDNRVYLRFRDECAAAGIASPIVPGILPILRFSQIQRFARRCGTSIPARLVSRFDGLDEGADTRRLLGAAVAIEQVEHLQRHGVNEFHFYTLNRADLTYAICHALGVRDRELKAGGAV